MTRNIRVGAFLSVTDLNLWEAYLPHLCSSIMRHDLGGRNRYNVEIRTTDE